jgi:hypothetical protein
MPRSTRRNPARLHQKMAQLRLDKRGVATMLPPSDARWSSLVARRAHNPKVGGSNPPRATTAKRPPRGRSRFGGRILDLMGCGGRKRASTQRTVSHWSAGANPPRASNCEEPPLGLSRFGEDFLCEHTTRVGISVAIKGPVGLPRRSRRGSGGRECSTRTLRLPRRNGGRRGHVCRLPRLERRRAQPGLWSSELRTS